MKWFDYPIKKIIPEDKNYPDNLKEIKNYPKSLYYRGNLAPEILAKSLAVVGTRRITRYGKMAVEKLIPDLVANQITIISGFMYGVDTEAHQKCLEYQGKTIAVLGGGLNVIYPPENEKLYGQILTAGGIIFSEYEPEFKPQLWTFPLRNRIVAGLSTLGILVIEAGEKSGSLITARFGREQGKKVFSVPGPITSSVSAGTNQLIQNHQAKMVLSAGDILGRKIETLALFSTQALSPTEKKIFRALETEPLTVDELARLIGQDVIETGKTLSFMSLKGLISDSTGKYYLNS